DKDYRCTSWKEDSPPDFADSLIMGYLPHPEYIGVVTYYGFIGDGTVAYLRFPDFNKIFTKYNYTRLDAVFSRASAIIVDIRQNMGGNSVIAETFASHFHNREVTVGYHLFNNGRHSSQQTEYPAIVIPSDEFNWSGKPVSVLTDWGTYSSANYFVLCMRQHPSSTIIGGITGGGAGLAVTRELPNGWQVNLSSGDTLDPNRNSVENGIVPDVTVRLDAEDAANGKDTIMEEALRALAEASGKGVKAK
ncbi:MAG: S41 family peptidase, partial [Candidatus Cryptobacteroides sp.]